MRAVLLLGLLGCQEVLLRDLPEAEANDVVAALASAGVAGEKQGSGARTLVRVPAGQVAPAWQALRAVGLPRPPTPPLPDRLVVGPTEARLFEHQRQSVALERVLRALPGVHDARVVVGDGGAAVVVRGVADRAQVAALVQAALPPGAQITLEINDLEARPRPVEAPPSASAPPPGGPLVALSAAVVALAAACTLLLVRLRRLQRPS